MNKIDFQKPSPCPSFLGGSVIRHDEPIDGAQLKVDCLGEPDDDFFGEDVEGENCDGKTAKSYREDSKTDIE